MNESQEKLYAIGEVARLTGVPVKTIRYYTDIDLLTPARRTEASFRLYATEMIWRLQLIRVLRQLEFGLEEIRSILGGNQTVSSAIDWQLEAIDQHMRQLQQVKEILQQAKGSRQEPARELETLYELGLALNTHAVERGQLVTKKLQALVEQAHLPEEWRRQLLAHFTWRSPETFSAQQQAAWREIVAILNDPAFAAEALRYNTPAFKEVHKDRDMAAYNQQTIALLQAAQAAAERGEAPESEEVRVLVEAWIKLTGVSVADMIKPANDLMQRFWTLMARLSGREAPPSYKEGLELLAAGIRVR